MGLTWAQYSGLMTALRLPTVLLTGFDPFGEAEINPSWEAVQRLHGTRVLGHQVVAAQLPTVFGRSLQRLRELMQEHRPSLVLCTGQAGGRPALGLERVAINIDDARIPDNAGAQPIDLPVVASGPAAYFTKLPIKAMLARLQSEGVRAEVSQSAGTFVCNHVFYGLMHELHTQPHWQDVRGGFIHVPWLAQQGEPWMEIDEIVRGLELAIGSALETVTDVTLAAGALD